MPCFGGLTVCGVVGLWRLYMANVLASPHYDEIRRLAELGVPMTKLAEDYEVNINTLWSQATKNDWLLPRKLKAKLDLEAAKSQSTSLLLGKGASEKAALALLETKEDRQKRVEHLQYIIAVEGLERTKQSGVIAENPQELKALVHVARQSVGLDADAPQIQLSLFANSDLSGPAIMEAQTYEAETLQPVSEDADFWG